jgi:hypothetical protein
MTKKCDSCRHRKESDQGLLGTAIRCANPVILKLAYTTKMPASDMPLTYAREICNKEGDGIFVYFEPKTPASGAAVAKDCPDCGHTIFASEEHICRTPKSAAVQPDDWRKEMNKHFTKAA